LYAAFGQFGDWLAIVQPLAFHAPNHTRQPFAVLNFARIPSEIQLRDLPMKMFSPDIVESSVDARNAEALSLIEVRLTP